MKIAVIGTGYVGLTTAVALAHLGHDIAGIDINAERVEGLNNGQCPIVEAGLPQYLAAGLRQSRLSFTTDIGNASTAELIFLCLPTPATPSGHPDLSALKTTCLSLRVLAATGAVVVCKSTVPVGTNQRIQQWLNREDMIVVSNPEFLREGTALADFLQPDRVVIGTDNTAAAKPLQEVYEQVTSNILVVAPVEAELIKYAANAFLATKLSFVNEIARLCAATDANPDAVLSGVGSDHRISSQFLKPGPGWGGSCFPKDTLALHRLASDLDVRTPVVDASIESNKVQTSYIADAIKELVGGGPGMIAVWGLTFKAGTDDTRDSPAVAIVEQLVADGHNVAAFDPEAKSTPAGVTRARSAESAVQGAELLVILTEWEEFAKVDLTSVRGAMAQPRVFDTRGILDRARAAEAGLTLGAAPARNITTQC